MMLTRPTVKSGKFLKRLLTQSVAPAVLTAAMLAAPSAYAQQTTSSIVGTVTESTGAPAAGVKVSVIHLPSGTTSVAASDANGHFSAPGLRVGGPYTVRFEPAGRQPEVVQNVFLQLGEPFSVSVALKPAAAAEVEEIVVSGDREALKMGAQTTFNRQAIDQAPTVSRDLKDIIKEDPKVYLDPTNGNAIQIVGTNNRFNSLTIDGIQANDDFGLNAGGYPTHHSPIPLDAIDQLAVVIAPFDVDYDGFQGGTVNIVTKSGTNDFHGTAYYYYTSDKLSGTRSGNVFHLIPKTQSRTRGGSLGGPIVPDKLFFFGAYDDYQTISPAPFVGGPTGTQVPGITGADIAQVQSIAQTKYGVNPGSFVSGTPEHDRTAIGKLDWNINDYHRASFTYERSESFQVLDGESSASGTLFLTPASSVSAPPRLSLSSDFYNYGQIMNNYALQEFDDWTEQFSTNFELGHKTVDSTRTPLGGYGNAEIRVITPEGGAIVFGPDVFSQANVLRTSTDTYKGKAKYQLGDHAISGGYEYLHNDYFNEFLPRSLGQYYFSSFANFAAGTAKQFQYANAISGNPLDNAAIWDYGVHNLYIQDRWQFDDKLTVQAGLRYEVYENPQTPRLNTTFTGLYGFGNNATLDGRDLVLPRLGFNYQILPDTDIHGGLGQFSTLGPAVWMSNNYSNDGYTQRSLFLTSGPLLNTSTLTVPAAAQALLASSKNLGFVNALDPNFKIPSSWRADFAVDHNFDTGLQLSADLLYTQVANAILYRDLRLAQIGTAPDGRPIYGNRATDTRGLNAGQDMFLTNTGKGDGLVESIAAKQSFNTFLGDIDLQAGYAHTKAEEVSPASSSIASSTYRNMAAADPNHPALANADYAAEHTITGSITWSKKFFDDAKTSVTLFGTARSGLPYSFTFACGSNPFGDSACQSGTGRELLYVPTANDPKVNWAQSKVTSAQMQAFIAQNGLGKYAGQIAPRNAFDDPWFESLDLHFAQELPSPIEGHKLTMTVDTTNFSNLLFPQWGRFEQLGFPRVVPVTAATISGNQYVFSSSSLAGPHQVIDGRTAIWQIQVGLHYTF